MSTISSKNWTAQWEQLECIQTDATGSDLENKPLVIRCLRVVKVEEVNRLCLKAICRARTPVRGNTHMHISQYANTCHTCTMDIPTPVNHPPPQPDRT